MADVLVIRAKSSAWSDEDIAYLRQWAGRKSSKQIAGVLRRTPIAVSSQGAKLGLSMGTSQRGSRWSAEEVELVRSLAGSVPVAVIAERLGRSVPSVHAKCRILGISTRLEDFEG